MIKDFLDETFPYVFFLMLKKYSKKFFFVILLQTREI